MKIIVINQPLRNRGDEAAHKALFRSLANCKGIEIEILFTHNQKEDIHDFNVNLPNVKYTIISEPHKGYVKIFHLIIKRKINILRHLHPLIRKICKIYQSADIIMCAPSGICMGKFQNWEHIFLLWIAKLMNKKIAYYGRSFGPFPTQTAENRIFKERSLQLLHSFDFISIRDAKTMELADKLSLKYIKTTDSAFLNNASDHINEIPEQLKLLQQKFIVFVPNELIWHPSYAGKTPAENIDQFYLSIIEIIQQKYPHHKIIMLPQLYNTINSDYNYFLSIKEKSKNDNIIVLPDTINSDIQQTIIAKSDFLIGARYHSIVFAINNNIPFVALSYEHKIAGLLKQLNKESQSVDIEHGLETLKGQKIILQSIKQKIETSHKDLDCTYLAKKIAKDAFKEFCSQFSITPINL